MDYQVLFNIAFTALGALGGILLTRIYSALDRMDEDLRKMPMNYVQKDDFKSAISDIKNDIRNGFTQINSSLNIISERLNDKMDKV